MSIYQGKKIYKNYPYSHNQLSADNPFRYMGLSYNPYLPKGVSQDNEENSNKNKNTSSPYDKGNKNKEKGWTRNSSTSLINNSYNIINNNSYNKNKNFAYLKNKKDHVAELFNYPNKEKERNNFNVYTTSSKYSRTPQINNKNNFNDNINNNIINDIRNDIKNDEDKNDINNNNFFNSQKLPNRYYNNNNRIKSNLNEIYQEKISDINLSEYNEPDCASIIKSFAYKEDQNRGNRDYMEDKSRVVQNINGDKNSYLFCLFDGHGGGDVSQFLQINFYKYFKEILPISNPEQNFTNLFNKVDEKIKDLNLLNMGSTACIIYITKENGKNVIYSANIGDTRAILFSEKNYKRLSYDHRATDPNESNRIIKNGGVVFAGRVYGSLMLSRAFGDWELKNYGVISDPHVTKTVMGEGDKFLVMATDGVWDVLDDEDIFEMIKNTNDSKELCNHIVKTAIDKGSMDNISCFAIKLN